MKTKIRFENYALYDHTGIAAHLERMAAKGWMLEKIGPWGWRYRKTDPKTVRFAVTYFPGADYYDPEPSEKELTFREFCESAGWNLAAASAQIQIFYNENPDPIPLDTDAMVQIENIHAAGKKSFLLTYWLYIGLALLQLFTVYGMQLSSSAVALFTQTAMILGLVCWSLLIVMSSFDLLNYYRWRRRAVRAAEEEGRFLPTKSYPWIYVTCLLLVLAAFAGWLLSTQDLRRVLIFLVSFCGVLLLTIAVNLCREILKKKGASKTKNLTITLIVDVVLAFVFVGGGGYWIARSDIGLDTPVDTYEAYGIAYEVYNDELPLYVDELKSADRTNYSNKIVQNNQSPLGWAFLGYQEARKDRGDLDEIWYYIVEIHSDWGFERCWEERLESGGGIWRLKDMVNEWDRGYVPIDPIPWNADAVYRVYEYKTPQDYYLLRWGNRFVRLRLDWEPTSEQKEIIAEKLATFEP